MKTISRRVCQGIVWVVPRILLAIQFPLIDELVSAQLISRKALLLLSPDMNFQFVKKNRVSGGLVFTAYLLLNMFYLPAHSSVKYQPSEDLINVAENILEDYYRSEGDDNGFQWRVIPLDSRVTLKLCDQALEGFWPYEPTNTRKVSVGIRCSGTVRWKVYVQAQVKSIRSVAVLNAPVSTGDELNEKIISMQQTDTLALRSAAIDDATELLGMTFKKNLRAGTVLSRGHLEIPISVKRGDIVNIISGSGSIAVRAQGFALSDGHVNELIKVRNSTSKQILQAYVLKAGYVQIVQ